MSDNIIREKSFYERECEICGKFEECRPYGIGGKWVCFSCGMKNESEAKKQFSLYRFNERIQ